MTERREKLSLQHLVHGGGAASLLGGPAPFDPTEAGTARGIRPMVAMVGTSERSK